MVNHRHILSVLVIVGFLSTIAQSVRFDLQSGHTKCIAEDIKSNSMTVGKYSIVNPNEGHPMPESHKITVRVTSAYGNNYHYADHVESSQFAFQAVEAGDYMACFWAADHKPQTTVTIDFDWKSGVAAKDWTNVAKKGSVEQTRKAMSTYLVPSKSAFYDIELTEIRDKVLELELKKLHETVTSIHDEMFYLREREQEMQELNRSTNSRMAWLGFFSLAVCLSVAGLQLWHLKTFFEKKKLI
ncbi:unnamed protein product [Ilex paraguariensis]|uniref:GOLD domain-containing protein n=1 Tax=Ilex paraguariensis TaxID=185542 RepID=A0ABC8R120_9AQUA